MDYGSLTFGEYMGLNFRVKDYECAARWSYTGFHEFRMKMARLIGLDLENMQGFRKKHPQDPEYIKWGDISWETVKSPLKILLGHSDDKGFINSEACKILYPEFKRFLDFFEPIEIFEKQEMNI